MVDRARPTSKKWRKRVTSQHDDDKNNNNSSSGREKSPGLPIHPWNDEHEPDWWFASTAIPLLAATLGPLANVLSIAALVTPWRMCLVAHVEESRAAACVWDGRRPEEALVAELQGVAFDDPDWSYWMNVGSLVVGFVGNFFLLCNFTHRIRYIVALPVTVACWYVATGILTAITLSMYRYVPPIRPQQTFTQGFWYAVLAACMYMLCAMLLMMNMLGYFLGHYPQHFALTESQRTLILQTMMFFVWLAGGGAIFSTVEKTYGDDEEASSPWSYVNALYFCDATILTVGFGDIYPTSNVGRGLVFPYSVVGIIMLGLVVSSITAFVRELGSEKVIKRHAERKRLRTIDRSVKSITEVPRLGNGSRQAISSPYDAVDLTKEHLVHFADQSPNPPISTASNDGPLDAVKRVGSRMVPSRLRADKTPKILLLREEKDRFVAMRRIQTSTRRYKNWYALLFSVIAFGLLWCVGAVVFWQAESHTQGLTYFQALYFCYVSLLTIGYGDLSPKSNAGRPFFVFWSLIAVPTMTILVSDLGETVINKFKTGTSGLADFTVLPQKGVWRNLLDRNPWLLHRLQRKKKEQEEKQRIDHGLLPYGPKPANPPTLEELAREEPPTAQLAVQLAEAIAQTAHDVRDASRRHYSYEEWVTFTRLIRFTARDDDHDDDHDDDLVQWDWIGENSPMMADKSEAEFVLDRLCESLRRYVRCQEEHGSHVWTGRSRVRAPSPLPPPSD
jgi:potassium channel subfamily K